MAVRCSLYNVTLFNYDVLRKEVLFFVYEIGGIIALISFIFSLICLSAVNIEKHALSCKYGVPFNMSRVDAKEFIGILLDVIKIISFGIILPSVFAILITYMLLGRHFDFQYEVIISPDTINLSFWYLATMCLMYKGIRSSRNVNKRLSKAALKIVRILLIAILFAVMYFPAKAMHSVAIIIVQESLAGQLSFDSFNYELLNVFIIIVYLIFGLFNIAVRNFSSYFTGEYYETTITTIDGKLFLRVFRYEGSKWIFVPCEISVENNELAIVYTKGTFIVKDIDSLVLKNVNYKVKSTDQVSDMIKEVLEALEAYITKRFIK